VVAFPVPAVGQALVGKPPREDQQIKITLDHGARPDSRSVGEPGADRIGHLRFDTGLATEREEGQIFDPRDAGQEWMHIL
jgi:hypothetical protein